jgi:hypothetical protein
MSFIFHTGESRYPDTLAVLEIPGTVLLVNHWIPLYNGMAYTSGIVKSVVPFPAGGKRETGDRVRGKTDKTNRSYLT